MRRGGGMVGVPGLGGDKEVQEDREESEGEGGGVQGLQEVLGVRYDELVAVLVEAIKEIDQRTQVQAQMQAQAQETEAQADGQAEAQTEAETQAQMQAQTGTEIGPCACGEVGEEGEGVAAEVMSLLARLNALEAEEAALNSQLDSLSLSLSPSLRA
jgi:hypothetical protein